MNKPTVTLNQVANAAKAIRDNNLLATSGRLDMQVRPPQSHRHGRIEPVLGEFTSESQGQALPTELITAVQVLYDRMCEMASQSPSNHDNEQFDKVNQQAKELTCQLDEANQTIEQLQNDKQALLQSMQSDETSSQPLMDELEQKDVKLKQREQRIAELSSQLREKTLSADQLQQKLTSLEEAFTDANQTIEQLQQRHQDSIDALESAHCNTLNQLRSAHAKALAELESNHVKSLQSMEQSHAESVQSIEQAHADSLTQQQTQLKNQYEAQIAAAERALTDALDENNNMHSTVESEREQRLLLQRSLQEYNLRCTDYEDTIASLKNEIIESKAVANRAQQSFIELEKTVAALKQGQLHQKKYIQQLEAKAARR